MCDDLLEHEPNNWWRGVHEAGHAIAAWSLGGAVSHIEARRTHCNSLTPASRVVVACAGEIAEQLLGNADIRGCGSDVDHRRDAVEQLRRVDGEAEATRVDGTAETRATELVQQQIDALTALACRIGNLIHGSAALGNNQLSGADAAEIARGCWSGDLPAPLVAPRRGVAGQTGCRITR